MLGAALIAGYVVALAALLALGLLGRLGATALALALAVLGAATTLCPLVAFLRDVRFPPLFLVVALGFGGAALLGGVVTARTLSR